MTAELPAAAASAPPALKMLIGGAPVSAADGGTFDVVSPVDGTVIARVAKGGAEDVDRAVAAAQRAFDGEWHTWSQTRRGQSGPHVTAGSRQAGRGRVPVTAPRSAGLVRLAHHITSCSPDGAPILAL